MSLLVTCDSGGWKTPQRVRQRADDAGVSQLPCATGDRAALLAAAAVARIGGGKIIANEFRSELIDVGRSIGNRELHGPVVRSWPAGLKKIILEDVYQPYRRLVQSEIDAAIQRHGYVIHLAVRTYPQRTPSGHWHRGDVGLAYDPGRVDEVDWCLDLIDELWEVTPELKVRRNYPRRGTHDGITRWMRRHFVERPYVGVELMLNRAWLCRTGRLRDRALAGLAGAIGRITPTMQRAA
ncbi:MAG: N-formylglutamate amidohydrolase [Planctomycetota bacterium]